MVARRRRLGAAWLTAARRGLGRWFRILKPPVFRIVRGIPRYARGRWLPLWGLLAVPFLVVMLPLYRKVRDLVRWKACALTVLVFEAIMIPVEHNSIVRGHWVYNEHRIFGPRVWGIPIEELLIYYLFPPVFVIMIFEYLRGVRGGRITLPLPVSALLARFRRLLVPWRGAAGTRAKARRG